MRPPSTEVWFTVAGALLGVLFVAIGSVSLDPLDHPRWLATDSWLAVVAYSILLGFCLPGFFLHFGLMGFGSLGGRPGDAVNWLTYPLVQGVLYGGVASVMISVGRAVRRMRGRRGESTETSALDRNSGPPPHRSSRRKLLGIVAAFVVAYGALSLFLLVPSVKATWFKDLDKERYFQIGLAIRADRQHLVGKSLDEVTKQLSLANVPWHEHEALQSFGTDRIYHFRGFALYVYLEPLPSELWQQSHKWSWTSLTGRTYPCWTSQQFQERGVRKLVASPGVRIDGVSEGKERMTQYWTAIDLECERINAEMERERRTTRK